MSSPTSFEQAIAASHRALDELTRDNPEPFFELYSQRRGNGGESIWAAGTRLVMQS